jgi:4-hydroxy-tetrahydrodipicolinate reductase
MRVAVTGATGRMGGAVLDTARERGAEAVPVSRASERIDGDVIPASGLASALADRRPDALVDFTTPEASVEYAGACAETGTPFVTGTTGFSEAEREALDRASEETPVLHAPNFSRGVGALDALVREASSSLSDYDVELTETHHNGKRDAPSGTAERLLATVEDTRETTGRTHGREGVQPREAGEIGVHVRRAGDVRGEHELLFAGNDEVLTLTHRVESRQVFAAGALDAAEWLADRDPGRYEFAEVLAA